MAELLRIENLTRVGILGLHTEEVFDSDRHHVVMPYTFGPAPNAFTPHRTDQTVKDWLGEDGAYHWGA